MSIIIKYYQLLSITNYYRLLSIIIKYYLIILSIILSIPLSIIIITIITITIITIITILSIPSRLCVFPQVVLQQVAAGPQPGLAARLAVPHQPGAHRAASPGPGSLQGDVAGKSHGKSQGAAPVRNR